MICPNCLISIPIDHQGDSNLTRGEETSLIYSNYMGRMKNHWQQFGDDIYRILKRKQITELLKREEEENKRWSYC